ncbi:MAG TPA: carboxypeptidase regulatory-like domain-containing protein, partial [Vicinamibacterales bacterium]|nr:carboxypeptidase regulatory-like domain-containing protein [Vicinamibacterales bacterium]
MQSGLTRKAGRSALLLSLALSISAGHLTYAQTPFRKIGEMELAVVGMSATPDPAVPVLPKNTPSGVRIAIRSGLGSISSADVIRYFGADTHVEGELAGPGLTEPLALSTADAPDRLLLLIPALQTSGDYRLSNLRLVAGGRSVLDVEPGSIPVQVIEQVLITSVRSRPLTLAEIKEKGIVLDRDDYLGFEFTMALKTESKAVTINFPVVFDHKGVALPEFSRPQVHASLDDERLPELPDIRPILMTVEGIGAGQKITLPSGEGVDVRIPGVLVIPGNVGYLKQFFSAQLFVANGAPAGSGLTVRDVTGTIKMPVGADLSPGTVDDPLSLAETTGGPQGTTLAVRGAGADATPGSADDVDALDPGEQGQAEFLLRGDLEGFHTIDFDIAAVLDGMATGSARVTGKASGGVLVRNPYFNVTFTAPSVVRRSERFKLFATVTNIGRSLANDVSMTLDTSRMSGARLLSDPTLRTDTLKAGDARTFEFEFESERTGQVVASYLKLDTTDGSTGNLRFTMGVGERGVPLSPDTLVLPSAVDQLPDGIVLAAMRVLGQAWSVATAPAGTLQPGVVPINKQAVIEKALALAEAGLRTTLGQPRGDAIRDLAVDFYGGVRLDLGFDQLLRQTDAGSALASALGAEFATAASIAGGPGAFHHAFSRIAASGLDLVAFSVSSGTAGAPADVTLTDAAGRRLARSTAAETKEIRGGVIIPFASGTAPLFGLLTDPSSAPFTLELASRGEGPVDLAVTFPRGDGTLVRATGSTSFLAASRARLRIDPSAGTLILETDVAGDGSFEATVPLSSEVLSPEGARLLSATVVGPETLSGAGAMGFHTALLFDRVVGARSAEETARYTLPSNSFRVLRRQLSGRLVFGQLDLPEGPNVPTTLTLTSVDDLKGAPGPGATVPLQSRLQDAGAIVTGRVLAAEGSTVLGALVRYFNYSDPTCEANTSFDVDQPLAAIPVGADGRFEFRYVRRDPCGKSFTLYTRDQVTGAARTISSFVRTPGERLTFDIAMLGTGSVSGIVRDLAGAPIGGALVTAFNQSSSGSVLTDGDGRYVVNDIAVGAVSVTARKNRTAGSAAGRIARAGTTAPVDVILDAGSSSVSGTVRRLEAGVVMPAAGALVYYNLFQEGRYTAVAGQFTAADGSFSFEGVPSGAFSIDVTLDTRTRETASRVGLVAQDEVLIGQDFTIQITAPATIRGTVRLPDGAVAPDVLVTQGEQTVLTDSAGRYELRNVPVRSEQTTVVTAETQDARRRGQAGVLITAPGVRDNVDINLSGLGAAEFLVLDPFGAPLANQEVVLLASWSMWNGACSTGCGCALVTARTDATGRVRFENLPIGQMTARATRLSGSFTDVVEATTTIVREGATASGVMRFKGFGVVTGLVLDPDGLPAFGSLVTVRSSVISRETCRMGEDDSHSVRTDTSGRFRLTNVGLGRVGLTTAHPFFPTTAGTTVTLTSQGESIDVTLRLTNTISGELSGTVYLPDGVTPAGAGVEVTANGMLPDVVVSTNELGQFRFAKVFPQGNYTVTARDAATGGVVQEKIYLSTGQSLVHNLRLKGRGTVRVRVVDGADLPVTGVIVHLTESDFPTRSFEAVADESSGGIASFEGVFEGPVAASATDPFGRGGRSSGVLPGPDAEVDLRVRLTTTGTVRGRFLMPDGTTPIPFGTVALQSGRSIIGQVTTAGSGDVGSFRFQYVPAGPIRLEAEDPLTGRTGFAVGALSTEGQEIVLDIFAQALGSVGGIVTSNGVPAAGASVDIVSGIYRVSTIADADGRYLVEGVPEGAVSVSAGVASGLLSGSRSGTLAGEGTLLTLDVSVRDAGRVTGRVFASDGVSPAPPSMVTLSVPGIASISLSTPTDAEGRFTFERVPAGLIGVSADVIGTLDRGKATVEVTGASTAEVVVTLNGIGSIEGRAIASNGTPTGGEVTLQGTGTFPYSLTITAGADGVFVLPEVLAGPFTATLRTRFGDFSLFASKAGTVVAGATPTAVELRLQDSGTVKGVVLRAGGTAPAPGTELKIEMTNGPSVLLFAETDGSFTALGVPLGSFTLRANDPFTTGVALVTGRAVVTNLELVDLGTIVLDDSANTVVSVDPLDGATGIALNRPVRLTFTDPLGSTGGIRVLNGTANVFASVTLSADGREATLQATWPDAVELTVSANTDVTDVYGRRLVVPFTSRFRTVDVSAPSVTTVNPVNSAIQIAPDASVVVTFNEPVAAATNLSSLISVNGPSGAVSGTTALIGPATATFTPSVPLAINAIYTVIVNGAVDASGNQQTAPFSTIFRTLDTIAPVLVLSTPPVWTTSARPLMQVVGNDAGSGASAATGSLSLDGTNVAFAPAGTVIQFTPPANLSEGAHTVEATMADRAGNLGALSAGFGVDTVPAVAGVVTGISDGQMLSGTISLGVSASDATSGLLRVDLVVDGTSHVRSFTPPVLEGSFDTRALLDGTHTFAVRALDIAGNPMSPLGPAITATVNNFPLLVTFNAPAANSRFRDTVTVTASPSEPVDRIEFTVGSMTITDSSSPYGVSLPLNGVAEGDAIVTARAFAANGETGTGTLTIVVDRTPPAAPVAALLTAEPPANGFSLVFGRAGAVEGSARVEIVNLANSATAIVSAASNGSFTASIAGSIDNTLSLVAVDGPGNRSTETRIAIRSTPSVEPAAGSTSLTFDGLIADRVGVGRSLAPDGQLDAVFTLNMAIGEGITRTLSFIDLAGPSMRSTRVGETVLGVAGGAGSTFLNNPDGQVGFPITSGGTLTLFAASEGFIQDGKTYTVTAGFTDGSRFVGTFRIVPATDRSLVPHTVEISAAQTTLPVGNTTPATTILTLTNIRDIDGTLVPDGAKIAVGVADLGSRNAAGKQFRSAGGTITEGTPSPNKADFRVFVLTGGSVSIAYSSSPVVPSARVGAETVVQVMPADANGNVIGDEAIGTLTLSLRRSSDGAVATVTPRAIYADKGDRRAQLRIEVRDANGNPAQDGTKVALTALQRDYLIPGCCWVNHESLGGSILGGEASPSGSEYRVFTVAGGVVQAEYSAIGLFAPTGEFKRARIQIIPADAAGVVANGAMPLGIAAVEISSAASAEWRLSHDTVQLVFPSTPVQITVDHVHDSLGNVVPDGSMILMSGKNNATKTLDGVFFHTSSGHGDIIDGAQSPNSTLKVFPLVDGRVGATYSTGSLTFEPGVTARLLLQVTTGDPSGNLLDQRAIAVKALSLVAPANARASVTPTKLFADGAVRTSRVTFEAILDAFGNPLPDGAKVVVTAAGQVALTPQGFWVESAGGQILEGEVSPNGPEFKVLTVQDGRVALTYSQNFALRTGESRLARISLMPANADGSYATRTRLVTVSVPLFGIASAAVTANPNVLYADGTDRRTTVTITNVRDASGEPVPDGTLVAATAIKDAAFTPDGRFFMGSAGGTILGGSPTSDSRFKSFPVTNGQVVIEYSAQGFAVTQGALFVQVSVAPVSATGE